MTDKRTNLCAWYPEGLILCKRFGPSGEGNSFAAAFVFVLFATQAATVPG